MTKPQDSNDPIGLVLSRLEGAKGAGRNKWQALCPAHEDRRPSLSIALAGDGRVLLNCHSGCSTEAVLESLGLAMADLFPRNARDAHRAPTPTGGEPGGLCGKGTYATVDEAIATIAGRLKGKPVGRWQYHSTDGVPCWVLRFETKGGKTYRPVSKGDDGWYIGDPAGLFKLYRLPELGCDPKVCVCEGEKAADVARGAGFNATTSAHGALSPGKTDWTPLAGREVVIFPDNNEAGQKYAREVTKILSRLEPPATVRIVDLPGLPTGGDMADFAAAREGMPPDEIRREVENLISQTTAVDRVSIVGGLRLTCMVDMKPEAIKWLWPERIPLGKLTVLAGDPNLGKSLVTLDMAARVSRGLPWPDLADSLAPTGNVILLSAEDDPNDTIRPRLDAAEADESRVFIVESVIRAADEKRDETECLFSLEKDLKKLEAHIAENGDVRLVVIDPISAYMGKADSNSNSDVRGLLAPLSALAARHSVAIVAVSHLNKNQDLDDMYRVTGSLAFVAAARSVWTVRKDTQDADRRLLLPTKINIAKGTTGMAFTVIESTSAFKAPRVKWEAKPVDAATAQAATQRSPGPSAEKLEEARGWLYGILSDSPVPAAEVKERATEVGIAGRTLDRAKKALGIDAHREGYSNEGRWLWGLPEEGKRDNDA